MAEELPIQRVEARFVGVPPIQRVERASGVSEVESDGPILRCLVSGSFQPFLEALHGYEVISLTSRSTHPSQCQGARSNPVRTRAATPATQENQ